MNDKMRHQLCVPGIVIFTSLLFLSGCGGSGGSTRQDPAVGPNGDSTPSTDDQPVSGDFNGGLTGRLLAVYKDKPVQIDLSTGLVSYMPIESIQDWLTDNGHSVNTHSASNKSHFEAGGPSSSQYVQTVPQCFRDEENLRFYDSCFAIYDAGYQRLNNVRIRDREIALAAKLSPSGRYVAFNEYFTIPGTKQWSDILLMELAGLSYVDTLELDIDNSAEASDSPLAWTPNDELVFTVPSDDRVVVYITSPGSLDIANTITLPASYQGEVMSLDVSPDGTRLLMGYNPSKGPYFGGVLLLDLNTLEIFVPAIVPSEVNQVPLGDNIKGNLLAPRWSPDGQWIMVIEGDTIFNDTAVNRPTYIYAVPANKSRTVLTADEPTDAILITLEYPDKPGLLTNSWRGEDYVYHHYDWVD